MSCVFDVKSCSNQVVFTLPSNLKTSLIRTLVDHRSRLECFFVVVIKPPATLQDYAATCILVLSQHIGNGNDVHGPIGDLDGGREEIGPYAILHPPGVGVDLCTSKLHHLQWKRATVWQRWMHIT